MSLLVCTRKESAFQAKSRRKLAEIGSFKRCEGKREENISVPLEEALVACLSLHTNAMKGTKVALENEPALNSKGPGKVCL